MSGCPENEWGYNAAKKRREEAAKIAKELSAYMEAFCEFSEATCQAVADHMERKYIELRMQCPRPEETDACLVAADILRRIRTASYSFSSRTKDYEK